MEPTLLLTGANGLVGRAVASSAAAAGWRVTALRRSGGGSGPSWDPEAGRVDLGDGSWDAVVHLAGETIAQRWTAAAKDRIRRSRVDGTRLLGNALSRLQRPPRVVVCASAVGFYGDTGEAWADEGRGPGTGFLADVCREWEAAAIGTLGGVSRVVCLRLGIVLSAGGGALARMLPAFRWGVGGRLGDGRQYWSWITLGDLVRVVERVIADERLVGPVNAVSPAPVTNAEFTRVLAAAVARPAILPMPGFLVSALFGEMGREAMLSSVRVRPARLLDAGFTWQQPGLEGALRSVCDAGARGGV